MIWLLIHGLITVKLSSFSFEAYPDSKVCGANMGPTWVLSAPDGPHVGPMNFVIWVVVLPSRIGQLWQSLAGHLVM